jgi:SagB-type dehydrogenase family enzyme
MLFRIFHRQTGVLSQRDAHPVIHDAAPTFKTYERFERQSLPSPATLSETLGDALRRRISDRAYDPAQSISISALSTVLHSGAGMHESRPDMGPSRFRPSGGALYPIECYVATFRVRELQSGLYHYEPRAHALERFPEGDANDILAACKDFFDPPDQRPAAIIILTSVWLRSYPKYGEFAYRLALMEAGHLMQNVLLAGAAVGLKSCPQAGFHSESIALALDISKEDEDPLYLALIGA